MKPAVVKEWRTTAALMQHTKFKRKLKTSPPEVLRGRLFRPSYSPASQSSRAAPPTPQHEAWVDERNAVAGATFWCQARGCYKEVTVRQAGLAPPTTGTCTCGAVHQLKWV